MKIPEKYFDKINMFFGVITCISALCINCLCISFISLFGPKINQPYDEKKETHTIVKMIDSLCYIVILCLFLNLILTLSTVDTKFNGQQVLEIYLQTIINLVIMYAPFIAFVSVWLNRRYKKHTSARNYLIVASIIIIILNVLALYAVVEYMKKKYS